jgi:hypothetical protein
MCGNVSGAISACSNAGLAVAKRIFGQCIRGLHDEVSPMLYISVMLSLPVRPRQTYKQTPSYKHGSESSLPDSWLL